MHAPQSKVKIEARLSEWQYVNGSLNWNSYLILLKRTGKTRDHDGCYLPIASRLGEIPVKGVNYKEVFVLIPWDEAVGLLLGVDEENSRLVFQTFTLHIGPIGFDSIRHVQCKVGEKIAIVRTDLEDYHYIVLEHEPIPNSHGQEQGQPPASAGCVRDHNTNNRCKEPSEEDECP